MVDCEVTVSVEVLAKGRQDGVNSSLVRVTVNGRSNLYNILRSHGGAQEILRRPEAAAEDEAWRPWKP